MPSEYATEASNQLAGLGNVVWVIIPMYHPCATKILMKNIRRRPPVAIHLYGTYGVDLSRYAWYCYSHMYQLLSFFKFPSKIGETTDKSSTYSCKPRGMRAHSRKRGLFRLHRIHLCNLCLVLSQLCLYEVAADMGE